MNSIEEARQELKASSRRIGDMVALMDMLKLALKHNAKSNREAQADMARLFAAWRREDATAHDEELKQYAQEICGFYASCDELIDILDATMEYVENMAAKGQIKHHLN